MALIMAGPNYGHFWPNVQIRAGQNRADKVVGSSCPLTEGMCVGDFVTHTYGEVNFRSSFGSALRYEQLPFV